MPQAMWASITGRINTSLSTSCALAVCHLADLSVHAVTRSDLMGAKRRLPIVPLKSAADRGPDLPGPYRPRPGSALLGHIAPMANGEPCPRVNTQGATASRDSQYFCHGQAWASAGRFILVPYCSHLVSCPYWPYPMIRIDSAVRQR